MTVGVQISQLAPSTLTTAAQAAVVAAKERSLLDGLGAEQLNAIGVMAKGTWRGLNKDCAYIGTRLYSMPCTPENIRRYIILDDRYALAQKKLQIALRMNPKTGPERWYWMQGIFGWLSVAHFATGIPAQFLYGGGEVENRDGSKVVMAFGPDRARVVLREMLYAAGKKPLFLPIPIQEFFRFEESHGLSFPWEAQERGLTRADAELLEMRRGQQRRAVRRRERDRPWTPTALKDWLTHAGGTTTKTPPALAAVLGQNVERGAVLDVPRFHGVIPSPELLMDYVRAWAEPVARTPIGSVMLESGSRYMDYLNGFPERLTNMSAEDIRKAQIAMATAKGQAIAGGVFSAATTVLVAAGVTAWVGAIVAIAGAVVQGLIKAFGGSLQGCPNAPRPFALRSLDDPECKLGLPDQSAVESLQVIQAVVKKFEENVNPAAAEGPPDDLPVEDDGNDNGGGTVIAAGIGIGALVMLARLFR